MLRNRTYIMGVLLFILFFVTGCSLKMTEDTIRDVDRNYSNGGSVVESDDSQEKTNENYSNGGSAVELGDSQEKTNDDYSNGELIVELGDSLGNTNGNYSNGGWVIEKGNWTFLATDKRVYKMKDDGSELQIIFESSQYRPAFLNIVNDKLYFLCGGIVEMNLDGSSAKGIYDGNYDTTCCTFENISGVYACNDYLYLGVKARISLNDYSKPAQNITASQANYHTINFTDEYIYFVDGNELRKVKQDGTDFQLLMSTFDTVDAMAIWENEIYLTTYYGNELYSVSLDSLNDDELVKGGRAGAPLLIDEGLIYCNYYESALFMDNSCAFASIDLEGNLQEIIVDGKLEKIGATKKWIYYQIVSNNAVYRYNKETKQIEMINLEHADNNRYADEQKDMFVAKSYFLGEIKEMSLDDSKISITGELYEIVDGNENLVEGNKFTFDVHDKVKYNGEGKHSWIWNYLEEEIKENGKPLCRSFMITVINGQVVEIITAG